MSKPAYVPPSEFMMNVMLNAMEWQNDLAKSLQSDVKQLKLQVVEDNTTICELLNEKNQLIEDNCVLKERIHELRDQINDLKAEINLIDPTGEARLEYF